MPVLPVLIINNDRNNNNDNNNLFVAAYSQTKDDESKNVAEHVQSHTNNEIIGTEHVKDFICATYTDGAVYCDKQSKTEYKNKDSLITAYNNKKNNDNDNGSQYEHYQLQQQLQQQQQPQQGTIQRSNTATHLYRGSSEATDFRTSSASLSVSTPADGGSSGGELQNVIVKPSNNTVKATSNYEIAFTTKTTGTIAIIEVKFPPGFQLGNANLMQRIGIKSPLFFTYSSNSTSDMIRFAANPAQTVGSDRTVRLTIGNIINSYSPGNDYQVSVTTRDAANNIIDGPTVSAPFELKENSYATSGGSDSNIMTQESVSQLYNTADVKLLPYDKSVEEPMTTTGIAERGSHSNNTIIVDELKDGVSKDLIFGTPPVDKNSVRKVVGVAVPCKEGEIATVGGYEIISNALEQPENNKIKVFVLCVKM
jgi:hypothetical protein